MRRLFALLIAGVVALLVGCQPSDSSKDGDGGGGDAPSGPVTVAVGEPVTLKQSAEEEATVVVLSAQWQPIGQGEYAAKPQSGTYLVLDVEWSGTGSYNPLYLKFRAESGQEADAFGGAMSAYEPSLGSGDLGGGKVRGFVVFDVAQSAGSVILTEVLGDTVGSWTIPA